ncbi:proton channel OtopLc-like isoform X2 [Amphiura filiformis]|uniref:proton channel OtopLc-like isoform X2 n=1 Tax=Amphiura filiformis TaxID=82378 RepID=UPI003B21A6F7
MQLVPVNRNAPPADVPRAFQQSIGRGRRYRGNFFKQDRNRPPSFKLQGLVQAWGKAKKNIGQAYATISEEPHHPAPYKDQGPMGSLELSLRYPTGVHVGMEDTNNFMDDDHGYHDDHGDHEEEDVWTILSIMHFMVVVSLVIVLDTAQIFLKYSPDLNAVTTAHVEGFFIFLYIIAIAWMVVVIVLKRPLPAEQDEEHIDETASNKYLNVGLLFFGTGSCLWKIMSTAAYIEKSGGACGNKGIYAFGSILNVAFTMLQIYYCWRFSKYCIVRWNPLARMMVMHLMATNVSVWARTVIEEIWEDFILKYIKTSIDGGYGDSGGGGGGGGGKYGKLIDPYTTEEQEQWIMDAGPALLGFGNTHNSSYNDTGVLDECDPKAGLGAAVYKASVFLYSFTIEYSIIAGAMFYIMWKNIGRRVKPNRTHVDHEYSFSFECGLLMGIMCTMCAAIILVLNIIYLGKPEKAEQSFSSYHGFRIFLNIVCITACVMAFFMIHKGGWVVDHNAGPAHVIDTFLLLLCVSGSFIQGIYTLVASAASIGMERFAGLILFDEFTHLAQTILQCVLILDAMHRKPPDNFRETRIKQVLMFILVTNITWWLLSTYELKGGYDIFPLENNYYGATAWYVIVHLAAPFDILFRFHSTACFFEIWSFGSVNTDDVH